MGLALSADAALLHPRCGSLRPPGIPVIDWGHPLAVGLEFYGLDTGSGLIVDLVKNRPQFLIGAQQFAPAAPSLSGAAINWANNNSLGFNSDDAIRSAQANGRFSWASGCSRTGTVNTNCYSWSRTANNGLSNPFVNCAFGWNDTFFTGNTQETVACHVNSNGLLTRVGTKAFTTSGKGTFNTLLGTFNAGTAIFYGNGKQVTGSTGLIAASANTNDAIVFSGFNGASPGGQFGGQIFYGAFWSRALLATEAVRLHTDPYCFLLFPQDQLFLAAQATMAGASYNDDMPQDRRQPIAY